MKIKEIANKDETKDCRRRHLLCRKHARLQESRLEAGHDAGRNKITGWLLPCLQLSQRGIRAFRPRTYRSWTLPQASSIPRTTRARKPGTTITKYTF